MGKLFNKLESIILTLTIVSLVFLIFIQFVNVKNEDIISTSQFNKEVKYVPLKDNLNSNAGVLILEILDNEYSNVCVLINGEPVNDFSRKSEIKVKVHQNDLVEIDGTKYLEQVRVKITGISKNIEKPKLNTIVTTSQSIEILGKVQLK